MTAPATRPRRSAGRLLAVLVVSVLVALSVLPARAAGGGGHGGGDGPVYVQLDPITVTIFRDNHAAGMYAVAMTLQLADANQRGEVQAAGSRLRDAMLRQLHALIENEERTGTEVTVSTVKRAMRAIARRELGSDVLVDLFVHSVLRKGA